MLELLLVLCTRLQSPNFMSLFAKIRKTRQHLRTFLRIIRFSVAFSCQKTSWSAATKRSNRMFCPSLSSYIQTLTQILLISLRLNVMSRSMDPLTWLWGKMRPETISSKINRSKISINSSTGFGGHCRRTLNSPWQYRSQVTIRI